MDSLIRARIGIIGGMGPAAGWDLAAKITQETPARCDQDHLDVVVVSLPSLISDRTEFIKVRTQVNPAIGIIKAVDLLLLCGVNLIGIPCNTSHSTEIFNPVSTWIGETHPDVELVNMIEEVAKYIKIKIPGVTVAGVLATSGTLMSNVYTNILNKYDIKTIYPNPSDQELLVHSAIYDPFYGIKAVNKISDRSRTDVRNAAKLLIGNGAECIVLGCTELPLALSDYEMNGIPIIDATRVLACALVHKAISIRR